MQAANEESIPKPRNLKPTAFRTLLAISIKTLGFSVFSGSCILCQLPSQRARDLCRHCERSLRWLRLPCILCALPAPQSGSSVSDTDTNIFSGTSVRNTSNQRSTRICAQCLRSPLLSPIVRVVAPIAYAGCARWLVAQQKHRQGSVHSRVLAELLGDAITVQYSLDGGASLPDLLVPVPLHWRREWSRGHNQSTLLAANLTKRFGITTHTQLVSRVAPTRSQQSLNRAERSRNLAHAFCLNKNAGSHLRGRRVAIVDDVVTTGATSRALAQILLEGGAEQVHLFAPTRAILKQ